MDKCPFCGADTRPGDNFCLNCGNRLLATTPSSPSQAQPSMGEATIAATEGWGGIGIPSGDGGAMAAAPSWGVEENAQTLFSPPVDQQPFISEAPTAASAPPDKIEQPARFILRSDTGEMLQEYPLDKFEITIGRAPNSDILLSKDKLTSRRHATVRYENGQYLLRDERSANGTFVNGQQIEDMTPHVLRENDHVGIGEHELLFRGFGVASQDDVENMQTINIIQQPAPEPTASTYADPHATVPATSEDQFVTNSIADSASEPFASFAPIDHIPAAPPVAQNAPAPYSSLPASSTPVSQLPASSTPEKSSSRTPETPVPAYTSSSSPSGINFNRLTSLPQPTLPDISALMAALSALDGQVTTLQNQLNSSQEAVRNHEAEVIQAANQLRAGVRNVADRMDNTIADVARNREALAWSELLQLMEDVMTNPRDIEYVTKLARKARELNKVFQLHQIVLSTMAECNSLLRSMIGERSGQD
jgi:pSer/pThr/pTyr-binding forkhead associated (FHA) protein